MSDYIWYPLWSDWVLYLVICSICLFFYKSNNKYLFQKLVYELKHNKIAILTCLILTVYVGISLLDSIHFKVSTNLSRTYNNNIVSLLDVALIPIGVDSEKSYTSPLTRYSSSYLMEINSTKKNMTNLSNSISKDILYVFINSLIKSILLSCILFYTTYLKYHLK